MTTDELTAATQRAARRRAAVSLARKQVQDMPAARRHALKREFELAEEQARIVLNLAR